MIREAAWGCLAHVNRQAVCGWLMPRDDSREVHPLGTWDGSNESASGDAPCPSAPDDRDSVNVAIEERENGVGDEFVGRLFVEGVGDVELGEFGSVLP